MSTLDSQPSCCTVEAIDSRAIESVLWFSVACRDHASPRAAPNRCSKIVDALRHNLRSTTATSLDDHL